MLAIENDVIGTAAASLAANMAKVGELQNKNQDLQDKNDVLGLNLQVATQQVALYCADAIKAAADLRQERVMFWTLMAALLVSGLSE